MRTRPQPHPEGLTVPRSTLSNHWRILREAGVVAVRTSGKTRLVTLRRNDLDTRLPGLLAAVLEELTGGLDGRPRGGRRGPGRILEATPCDWNSAHPPASWRRSNLGPSPYHPPRAQPNG
ncbi:ArsR/SmtB family transcription factor [Kitasatospora aureofaciens]|uniref:ArsR/SmtB family transcription factor n=1 Tax=Kitasatospora aureofaciens TaxID=1894 RepID=UPI0036F4A867